MRLAATLAFTLLAGTALADGCDRWSAKMEEDEGGPVMTAAICAKASSGAAGQEHLLLVTCGGDNTLSMRFLPVAPESFPPGGNEEFKTDLKLSMDEVSLTLPAHFESMDGAMVFSAGFGTPLLDGMMSHKAISLSDPAGAVPAATFTLEGSKKALRKVIASCSQ